LELGGSSIEEGVEQPAGVSSSLYLVVMERMVTISGDCVGYFRIFQRKIFENRLPRGGNGNYASLLNKSSCLVACSFRCEQMYYNH
jgi:hypothetical protein